MLIANFCLFLIAEEETTDYSILKKSQICFEAIKVVATKRSISFPFFFSSELVESQNGAVFTYLYLTLCKSGDVGPHAKIWCRPKGCTLSDFF